LYCILHVQDQYYGYIKPVTEKSEFSDHSDTIHEKLFFSSISFVKMATGPGLTKN